MRVFIAGLIMMIAVGCTVNKKEYVAAADAAVKAPTYEQAMKHYEDNVTKSVHSHYYYAGIGDIDYAYGRYGEAVNAYTRALKNSARPEYNLKRGRAYLKLNYYSDASIDFRTVIEVSGKKYPVAYVERAKAYAAMGKYKEAMEDLEKAKRWGGESSEFLVAMGELLYNMQKYDEAKNYIQKAAIKTPEDSNIYLIRGKIFYKQKDANQAINDFEKAVSLDKSNLEAKRMLAWTYATNPLDSYRNGNKAVMIAKELFELNSVQYAEVLAAAYAELGDFDSAVRVLEEAISDTQDLVQKEDFRFDIKNYKKGDPIRMW